MDYMNKEFAKRINEAIDQCLGLWWEEDKEKCILTKYGVDILNAVKEVYKFTMKYEVDWSKETLESAMPKLEMALHNRYPFLDDVSIRRLGNNFAYSWK